MNHKLCPEFERILMVGCSKGIIDHHHGPDPVGLLANLRYIDDLTERVGRGLQKDHARIGP